MGEVIELAGIAIGMVSGMLLVAYTYGRNSVDRKKFEDLESMVHRIEIRLVRIETGLGINGNGEK